ncbi:MAG TPA: NTP transferase domain-containing protein, partial [Spirochaetota bacterium]|nr:NTP transferase domain-containing protein [Spirochaetota bacterium]
MSAAANDITAVLLAAGKGVRMQSELPKVLHPLNGTPLIRHVIDSVMAAGIRDIIDLRPLGPSLVTAKTITLAKTADLELIRLVLPVGKELPTHKVPGEITVQCLEGRVA